MRRIKVMTIVNEQGEATVEELANTFNVSVETIRRDLRKLDEEGAIKKVHGGAVSNKINDVGRSFTERAKDNIKIKDSLVNEALTKIRKNMVIGLDASSSSWCLARKLPDIPCTVITNSLNNVLAIEGKRNINVICTGGSYSAKYGGFHGPVAINALFNMYADISFISCVGFDYKSGAWDSNEYNYQIKRTFIKISNEIILIADKSKYGKKSLLKICDSDAITSIITDK